MKTLFLPALLFSLFLPLLAPTSASAEQAGYEVPPPPAGATYSSERPKSGIGGIVMGSVGLGLGAMNLATIPVCYASFYPANATELCTIMSLSVGSVLIAVGIPSLIVGKIRRNRYKEWKRARMGGRVLVEDVAPVGVAGGGGIAIKGRF
jgi:hypothetical protein